jgi:hypothetical protein
MSEEAIYLVEYRFRGDLSTYKAVVKATDVNEAWQKFVNWYTGGDNNGAIEIIESKVNILSKYFIE